MSRVIGWSWTIDSKGLSIREAFTHTVEVDFATKEEGELWVKQQLANLILGNPLDTALARTLVMRPHHREALFKQAKRELLHE